MQTRRPRQGSFWPGASFILLFNGLLLSWLLVKPGGHDLTVAVDDILQVLGPLLTLPLCLVGGRTGWRAWRGNAAGYDEHHGVRPGRHWAPVLLGLGVLSFAVGQGIWAIYELVLHRPPFPSWADAGYLSAYPFLLLGVLVLPTRPLPLAARTRLVLDALMTMTAVVTFSWYFILGPTLLQGAESALARIVGTAYPLFDLVLVFCLIVLAARSSDRPMRRVLHMLSLALGIIVITDCIFDLQNLQGTYATGGLVDVGWPLGYMLVALAAHATRRAARGQMPVQTAPDAAAAWTAADDAPPLWRSFLPYALVPAVGVLVVVDTWVLHGDVALRMGVYVGGAVLIALILLRQILAMQENRTLYGRLNASYRLTVASADQLRQRNDELRATRDELEVNNHALTQANQRLQALATTDPLTDLPNHRALMAAIDQELERTHRYRRPCAILFFDLDYFKALNDSYGHPSGDTALREIAAVVRAALRGGDILGRWGGEEFVALLPETDGDAALTAAERVRAAVAAHSFRVGGGAHLTCSIGVATYPRDATDRDGLIAVADQAMYAAKRLGRNQARLASDPAVAALAAANEAADARQEAALVGTVEALAALVEARDHYTGQHTHEVAALAMRLALALGLDTSQARMVGLVGRLHDVGKVAIPDAVLQKPGRLTENEWVLMRAHAAVGADVVRRVPALRVLAPLIHAHHEKWDGSGYPDGLTGEEIPLGARIVAVADAYGAMTTDRPYRPACTPAAALAELRRCAGTQFDPAVIATVERVLATMGAPAEHTGAA
jgi:diguanylate cyclase (GGDEF)-like protein/putative nucleotidyltransferase with HDIG domain